MSFGDPNYPGGQPPSPYGPGPAGPPPGPPGGYGPPPGGYGSPSTPPGGYGAPVDPYGQPPQSGPPGYGAPDPYAQPPMSAPPTSGQPYGQPAYGQPPGYPPFGPPPPKKSGSGALIAVLAGVGVLILLGAAALVAFLVFKDDGKKNNEGKKDPSASASSAAPTNVDIASRDTDPTPLTVQEVFPGNTIPTGYTIVNKKEEKACASAGTEGIPAILDKLGCNQMVRAAINTPDGVYGICLGVFNMKEGSEVTAAKEEIRTTNGGFRCVSGTGAAGKINDNQGLLGWSDIGHYLGFIIVVRADNTKIETNDANYRKFRNDLLDTYLDSTIRKREG